MTATLEELKDKLYKQFDAAVTQADNWRASNEQNTENRKAAAEIANAIVLIETRLDERKEREGGMKLPGKG